MLEHLNSWQFNGGNQANFVRLMVNETGLHPVFLSKIRGIHSEDIREKNDMEDVTAMSHDFQEHICLSVT